MYVGESELESSARPSAARRLGMESTAHQSKWYSRADTDAKNLEGTITGLAGLGDKVKLHFSGVGDVEFSMRSVRNAYEAKHRGMESLVEWIAEKLEDERREVLLQLQQKHVEFIEQFLVKTITPRTGSARADKEVSGAKVKASFEQGTPSTISAGLWTQASPPDIVEQLLVQPQGTLATRNPHTFTVQRASPTGIATRKSESDGIGALSLSTDNAEYGNEIRDASKATERRPSESYALCTAAAALAAEPKDTRGNRVSASSDQHMVVQQASMLMSQPLGENDYFKQPVPLTPFESSRYGQMFEATMAGVIFANTIVMAFNAQYRGLDMGYNLSVRSYTEPGEEAWPGGKVTFDVLEKFFTIVFTLELGFRFYLHRLNYFYDRWCYIDGSIVLLAWILFFGADVIKINMTFVRLARFSKIVRLVHLLRSQEIFDSLKFLLAAIKASVSTLFWSLSVILLIQGIFGLGMLQLLEPFMTDATKDPEVRRRVFQHFGTFWRAMVTMFEITFANWAPSCRLLMDHVNELYGIFYLMYRCVIGFCVLMVVQAVFIQQTMQTTKLDDKHLAALKARQRKALYKRLENVFRILDTNGDGDLEWEEMAPILTSDELAAMLEIFEIEVEDFHILFDLLDDGTGLISIDAFVKGIQHIKGQARTVDVLELKRLVKKADAKFDALFSQLASSDQTASTKRADPRMGSLIV